MEGRQLKDGIRKGGEGLIRQGKGERKGREGKEGRRNGDFLFAGQIEYNIRTNKKTFQRPCREVQANTYSNYGRLLAHTTGVVNFDNVIKQYCSDQAGERCGGVAQFLKDTRDYYDRDAIWLLS